MNKRNIPLASLIGVTAGITAGVTAYVKIARPWFLHWGSTDEEVTRALPGDDLLPTAKINATHAVTVDAPPEQVWPWLIQIGQGRGGFYSYDWIENAMGLDIHNTDHILPEYQTLQVGDKIPLAPDGFGIPVAILEPERTLVLHGDTRTGGTGTPPMKPGEHLAVSWGFYLEPLPEGKTRLIERWKADWTPTLTNNVFYRAFLEPGAFVMEHKMLLGIKERAEMKQVVPVKKTGELVQS